MKQYISYLLFLLLLANQHTAQAQKKKRSNNTTTTQTKEPEKQKDTVIVILDREGNEVYRNKPIIKPAFTKDTVIILSKGKQKKVLKEPTVDTPKVVIRKVNEECSCVNLTVTAPDTLEYETYVNYTFKFKNNCKQLLWVNSESFTFLVFNPNGTPAKVLRKLQYVKQYKYPAFVPLSPGEEYEFSFADDPFFQYDLRTGWKYKFTFAYFSPKAKKSSGKTYQCTEYRDKMISIK